MTLRPQEQHIALLAQRAEQQSAEFKAEYKRRAGVEATISQGLRVGGLRQSRYIGAAKTALQHILIAVALKLVRLVAWWEEQPLARTRVSTFAALGSQTGNKTVIRFYERSDQGYDARSISVLKTKLQRR